MPLTRPITERPAHQYFVATEDFRLDDVYPGGEVMDEDLLNLPHVQAGMNSSAFKQLHLNEQKIRILHFQGTLMQYLEA